MRWCMNCYKTLIRTVLYCYTNCYMNLCMHCYINCYSTVIRTVIPLLWSCYTNCHTTVIRTVILNIFSKVHQHIVFAPSHNYLPAPPRLNHAIVLHLNPPSSHRIPRLSRVNPSFVRATSCLQFASIIKIYATINTLNCASQAKRNAQREEM